MGSAMAFSSIVLCLLPLPHIGNAHHTTSYTREPTHFVVQRSADPPRASTAPATWPCSSIHPGVTAKKLPLLHRLSPCSPLNAGGEGIPASSTDVFLRDGHRLHSLFAAVRSSSSAPAAAYVAAPSGGVTIPVTGTPLSATTPGFHDYVVVVGYGTPAQRLPVALDTNLGISLVRCKPCRSWAQCDPAFDPSLSSTFTRVPCSSLDCRNNCAAASTCPLPFDMTAVLGAVVQDVLTLTQSASVEGFTFGCVEAYSSSVSPPPGAGLLDLSRDSRSLASWLAAAAGGHGGPATFSYCFPLSTTSNGFLAIGGGDQPRNSFGGRVTVAPMVDIPSFPNYYAVELAGISLGGRELPIPPAASAGNITVLDTASSLTYLKPSVYAVLRDAFRREMSQYPPASAYGPMDTCYNFTGLRVQQVAIPLLQLKLGNFGDSWLFLGAEQMLAYSSESSFFSVACLAFAALPSDDAPFSLLGTMAQASTEVVYDVRGGKVGFMPQSC